MKSIIRFTGIVICGAAIEYLSERYRIAISLPAILAIVPVPMMLMHRMIKEV